MKKVILILTLGMAATGCSLPTAPQSSGSAAKDPLPLNVTSSDVDTWFQTALGRTAVQKEHALFDGMDRAAFLQRVEREGGCHPKPLTTVTPWDVDQCVWWYTKPHVHASPATLEEYKDQEWTTFMDCLMLEIESGTLADY